MNIHTQRIFDAVGSHGDPIFARIQGAENSFSKKIKQNVIDMYSECYHLVDKKFPSQIRHDFVACWAELYLAFVLRRKFGEELSHPSDTGPDLFLRNLQCWFEITKVTDGDRNNENSVPTIQNGECGSFPEDQVILRLTGAIDTKIRKLQNITDNIICDDHPVVICLNAIGLSQRIPTYPIGGVPQIVKAVYPYGDYSLQFDKGSNKITGSKIEFRGTVLKKPATPISTDYFFRQDNSIVSAVIYSYADPTSDLSKAGQDLIVVHNCRAKNKIPVGTFDFGEEFWAKEHEESFEILRLSHVAG